MTTAIDTRKEILAGSLADVAAQNKQSIAETFINADAVVLIDTSASMDTCDSRENRKRYDVACEELKALQAALPGKLAVLSFSSRTIFCPSGVPLFQQGGTDMADALKFAKVADVPGIRFILVSDGEPDSPSATLEQAHRYRNKINTIYVGSEIRPQGRDFLAQLAAISGGQAATTYQVNNLVASVQKLLA